MLGLKQKKQRMNVLVVGNGVYATGNTGLSGKQVEEDWGVVLPALFELRKEGLVDKLFLADRKGNQFPALRKKIERMSKLFGWEGQVTLFPKEFETNGNAYKDALRELPKPAAVIIATPDDLHKSIMLDAINNCVHFLVVKPAVINLKDWKEVVSIQNKSGVLGMVDYHKVYDDANLIIKQSYERGDYGDLQHVYSRQTDRRDLLKIFRNRLKNSGTNVNHFLGSHYIHLVGFITGATPETVRATCQFGVAKSKYGIDTPDLIETHIVWRAKNRTRFSSYHVAGWSDPSETSAMTYQDIHFLGTKAIVDSEQRYRGLEIVAANEGQKIINPYFFNFHKGINGELDLDSQYGYKSFKTFIKSALKVEAGIAPENFENKFPTIAESLKVTAILEAADKSLRKDSSIIKITLP
ncbi:hypothetical protein A2662_02575 [Candidatus Giovannonibacteria bacterium RIFCSPHIGHO2_01_FULL_45_33]|uniref:Gfo/Idh/MocA-like oxidoreductase N-terminal domain-containing protein n=1 Tax=Candidatus Giovannonibacteria bacterium RIFCSPLOWO2_01_FULL_45_34 TaxID=1798351 RepID=A0A1F5WYG4_9BACT|nr:MAG: hypothetical protein A2662_02575 [Candidatus Giovannonibacteria bacterium RIFCSPHIGHO2_01_FULL_45_33]OGF70965.1 MAG: hypothetical protein A3C73_04035 [Candidatus Giovannonibacteria bacterium RIFCSPHIGHO2_02_FULL_44_11]OGF80684.1 MAG: hypothetical protein A2930_01800 [Candidatus Giovannonibacteria bacterium RIFCSPLOWO2_01_FULL_45_34]